MKKQIRGYYYRTGSETLKEAIAHCWDSFNGLSLYKTVSKAKKVAENDRKDGLINFKSKIHVIKVIYEDVN